MPQPINDAQVYGVRIVEADVQPGNKYWKVVRVHHLTPGENGGRHHIYIDALDEQGQRAFNTPIKVNWVGDSHTIRIEKPLPEAGTNEPMWKWQVYSVRVAGQPSDRVENLRTDHPDEAPGNTLFHHSFLVTFQRTVAAAAKATIGGRVPGGAGHIVMLLAANRQNGPTARVGADERYQFEDVEAGSYSVADQDDGRRAGPVVVTGAQAVTLDLPALLIPNAKALRHYVFFGALTEPANRLRLSLLADHLAQNRLAFGGALADALQAERVTIVGEQSADITNALTAAGVQVQQLPGDPAVLLAALRQQPS